MLLGKQCGNCPKAMRPAQQLSDIPEPHTIPLRSSTPPPTVAAISEQLGSCRNGCEMYREKKGLSETPLNSKAAASQPGNTSACSSFHHDHQGLCHVCQPRSLSRHYWKWLEGKDEYQGSSLVHVPVLLLCRFLAPFHSPSFLPCKVSYSNIHLTQDA